MAASCAPATRCGRIVEHKDAERGAARASARSIPASWRCPTRCSSAGWRGLTNDNAQGEYYLTDIVQLAVEDGAEVVAVQAPDQVQVDGVNSPLQLAELERAFQLRQARALMEQGVRLADPARFDVRGTPRMRAGRRDRRQLRVRRAR